MMAAPYNLEPGDTPTWKVSATDSKGSSTNSSSYTTSSGITDTPWGVMAIPWFPDLSPPSLNITGFTTFTANQDSGNLPISVMIVEYTCATCGGWTFL